MWYVEICVLFYCIDLLKKVGYNEVLKIWDELFDVVFKFFKCGKDMYGFVIDLNE